MQVALDLEGGLIKSATLNQSAPPEHLTLRPHRLRIGLFDLEGRALRNGVARSSSTSGQDRAGPELAGTELPTSFSPTTRT